MWDFFKQWLKAQASYFFWGYVPWLFVLIFGVIAVTYFRSYALQATGVFILLVFAFVIWLNRPH